MKYKLLAETEDFVVLLVPHDEVSTLELKYPQNWINFIQELYSNGYDFVDMVGSILTCKKTSSSISSSSLV